MLMDLLGLYSVLGYFLLYAQPSARFIGPAPVRQPPHRLENVKKAAALKESRPADQEEELSGVIEGRRLFQDPSTTSHAMPMAQGPKGYASDVRRGIWDDLPRAAL